MCIGQMGMGYPPLGIPIPHEIHRQFPIGVRWAWFWFHAWWKKALKVSDRSGKPVRRSDMSWLTAYYYSIIKAAPIPDHDGATGEDSCYIKGVEMQFAD